MNRRARLVAVAMLAAPLVADPSLAARLPDWAEGLAESAADVPDGVSKNDYVTLLYEKRIVVHPNGTFEVRLRTAQQALNASGSDIGIGSYPFGQHAEIRRSRGWHLPAGQQDGKRRRASRTSRLDEVDIKLDSSFVTDKMVHAIGLSDVGRGSLVFFEFEAEESPYALSFIETFLLDAPTDRVELTIELPEGWDLTWHWIQHEQSPPSVEGRVYRWTLENLSRIETEEFGATLWELSPRLAVGLQPPSDAKTVAPGFSDWSDLSRWYEDLSRGLHEPTDAVRAELGAVVPAEKDLAVEEIVSVARHVRDRVRYVAKEVGIGGYRPRSAAETLNDLYGDCKDKGTLLRAMLASRGVESYPVLINATTRGTVTEDVPTLDAFNHFVVAVPLTRDEERGERSAILETDRWGRLLFLDTTDELTTPGWLPSALSGQRALVVSPDGGGLVELPGWTADAHRLESRLVVEPAADGTHRYERTDRRYGEPATWSRAQYVSSASEARTRAVAEIKAIWLDASVEAFDVTTESEDGAYVERRAWTAGSVAHGSDLAGVPAFPAAREIVPLVSLSRREGPVIFRFPRAVRAEFELRGLPPAMQPPAGGAREGDGWRVESAFESDGETLRGRLDVRLDKTRFEKPEFRELRKFYAALRSLGGLSVLFEQ